MYFILKSSAKVEALAKSRGKKICIKDRTRPAVYGNNVTFYAVHNDIVFYD